MSDDKEKQPRIIVDDDWKQQAAQEKEEADRTARDAPQGGEIPPPSLVEIVQMLAMQAAIGLGGFQDPQTGQTIPPQLPVAKHYIDLLELFQQKTAGAVDEQEKQIIDGTLNELRMAFVQAAGVGAAPPNDPDRP
jgi:hypothetical protein